MFFRENHSLEQCSLTHSLVPSKIYLDEKCERLDIDALSVSFIMFLAMMGCVEPDKSQVSAVMI